MPRYERAPDEVGQLAHDLLKRYDTHQPLLDAMVRIDLLYAYPELNDDNEIIGPAITQQGYKVLAMTKITNLKDRAKGLGDAEILIDKEHWDDCSKEQKMALLDHELHHLEVKMKDGQVIWDDLDRPKLRIRKHDVQIGWFDVIAQRHGEASAERIQARTLMEESGQLYWPEFVTVPAVP